MKRKETKRRKRIKNNKSKGERKKNLSQLFLFYGFETIESARTFEQ